MLLGYYRLLLASCYEPVTTAHLVVMSVASNSGR